MSDVQEILRQIGAHWANGSDGNFSADWDQDNADPGFWLPAEDATAILRLFAELQLVLNPVVELSSQD